MKLSKIKPNPDNPRIIKDSNFEKLCNSIKEFPKMMSLRPIVVDNSNMVLGGNMRLKALQHLGFKEIPDDWVKCADELTEQEQRRFIIADNVSGGEWNTEDLAADWDKVELEEWGLEIADEVAAMQIKEIEIKPFKKTHVLFSFSPEIMIDIQDFIQKIKDTNGVEYEQASN